jgi:hypothetical protein
LPGPILESNAGGKDVDSYVSWGRVGVGRRRDGCVGQLLRKIFLLVSVRVPAGNRWLTETE